MTLTMETKTFDRLKEIFQELDILRLKVASPKEGLPDRYQIKMRSVELLDEAQILLDKIEDYVERIDTINTDPITKERLCRCLELLKYTSDPPEVLDLIRDISSIYNTFPSEPVIVEKN